MLITQRLPGGDTMWHVCQLKSCSAVAAGERQADGNTLIPQGWCIRRRPEDPPQMAVVPVYCCPEHALEDDSRTAHDRQGNEVEFPKPSSLELVRRPLDDLNLRPMGGI